MRRLLLPVVVGLAVAALFAGPAATAQTPTQDTAAGDGHVTIPVPGSQIPFHLFGFNFNAASGPEGENATGEVINLTTGERVGAMTFTGHVTCLAVSGTRAAVGAVGTYFGFPAAVLMTVVDGGPPNSGADTANVAIRVDSQTSPPPPACSTASFSNQLIVTTGDVVVRDAPPLPTSKDQCKKGGWRNYGDRFKNQGACVSFVATGGKKKP
jgi:hypothetical protein